MPSTSESQRRLFGMVLAAKRGRLKHPSPKIKQVASQVSEKSASEFAGSVSKKRKGEY